MFMWWNGRHNRLKICRSIGHVGSTPTMNTLWGCSITDNYGTLLKFKSGFDSWQPYLDEKDKSCSLMDSNMVCGEMKISDLHLNGLLEVVAVIEKKIDDYFIKKQETR